MMLHLHVTGGGDSITWISRLQDLEEGWKYYRFHQHSLMQAD